MSSFSYGGKLQMMVDESSRIQSDDLHSYLGEYPFSIPRVYIDGSGEQYYPQILFSYSNDSVVVVRGNCIVKYTKAIFTELLAEDEDGNVIWVDGRTAPYASCWGGKYLDEEREAHEYSVEEYDLNTLKMKRYKVIHEETFELEARDVDKIMKLYGEEEFVLP